MCVVDQETSPYAAEMKAFPTRARGTSTSAKKREGDEDDASEDDAANDEYAARHFARMKRQRQEQRAY